VSTQSIDGDNQDKFIAARPLVRGLGDGQRNESTPPRYNTHMRWVLYPSLLNRTISVNTLNTFPFVSDGNQFRLYHFPWLHDQRCSVAHAQSLIGKAIPTLSQFLKPILHSLAAYLPPRYNLAQHINPTRRDQIIPTWRVSS
jgi:hypothetical protein